MMRQLVRKFLTRRGTFLASFGAVYAIIGYSILTISNAPAVQAQVHKALHTALRVAPLDVYGWLWIASGVIAIVASWTPRYEMWGFGTTAFMPTLWAVVYFSAWNTMPRAWLSAVVYLLLAASVLIVAGLPDPSELEELRQALHMRNGGE